VKGGGRLEKKDRPKVLNLEKTKKKKKMYEKIKEVRKMGSRGIQQPLINQEVQKKSADRNRGGQIRPQKEGKGRGSFRSLTINPELT